ncbi:hypothetical protein DR046_22585, partial [Jannaschia formosa]
MTRRPRRNHGAAFKARVALEAVKGERRLTDLAQQYDVHAPKRLHDELTEDYRDMICAETTTEVEAKRKAFLRKWRLK